MTAEKASTPKLSLQILTQMVEISTLRLLRNILIRFPMLGLFSLHTLSKKSTLTADQYLRSSKQPRFPSSTFLMPLISSSIWISSVSLCDVYNNNFWHTLVILCWGKVKSERNAQRWQINPASQSADRAERRQSIDGTVPSYHRCTQDIICLPSFVILII